MLLLLVLDSILLADEDLQNIIQDDEIIDGDYIDNNIPNYVIDDTGPDDILKTEILICEHCMRPNVISTTPFNRRVKEIKQLRLDSVVYASLYNKAKLNKLDINALLSLLLKLMEDPDLNKKMIEKFSNIPKRKGKAYRSKKILSSSSS